MIPATLKGILKTTASRTALRLITAKLRKTPRPIRQETTGTEIMVSIAEQLPLRPWLKIRFQIHTRSKDTMASPAITKRCLMCECPLLNLKLSEH